jgi:putative transposase
MRTGSPSGAISSTAGCARQALIVADGAPGLWKAARELWPKAEEQRCTVHALRNATGKLPERHHRDLKARRWQVFDDATTAADGRRGLQAIMADYRAAYPSAMAVITTTSTPWSRTCAGPPNTRKRIRSTNLLERTFVEVRRRTTVIGRFPTSPAR